MNNNEQNLFSVPITDEEEAIWQRAEALCTKWKSGQRIKVKTLPQKTFSGDLPGGLVFEIDPVRLFGTGPVIAATVLVNGKPVRDQKGLMMSREAFCAWMTSLEEVA